ncbi:MAG: hypothetical protein ACT4ON_08055 [Bacteroidota bacterium]
MSTDLKDIYLEELYSSSEISTRALNVCHSAGINTLKELNNYKKKHRSFRGIPNCGLKTSRELRILHRYYTELGFERSINIEKDISNAQIRPYFVEKEIADAQIHTCLDVETTIKNEFDKMGLRARNAFMVYFGNNFPSQYRLKQEFIIRQFNPLKLRNIGKGTVAEIQMFIDSVTNILIESIDSEMPDTSIRTLIKEEFEILGVRSRNALMAYFDNELPTPDKLREVFIINQFDPQKLRNVGTKSAIEIQELIDKIIPVL